MLIFDFRAIGNRLLSVRKRLGLTQSEVAEAAGLSDRTYADIERGSVNMRIESILKICNVLHITPDEISVRMSLANLNTSFIHWHQYLHGSSAERVQDIWVKMTEDAELLCGMYF